MSRARKGAGVTGDDEATRLPRVLAWTTEMEFVGMTAEAGVIDGGIRVFSQATALRLLGMSRGGKRERLAAFASQKALAPFVSKHLANGNVSLIEFDHGGAGRAAYGVDVRDFVRVCRGVRDAAAAGALHVQHQHIAAKATAILDALADVAVEALVDEASGYQEIRPEGDLGDRFTKGAITMYRDQTDGISRMLSGPAPEPPAPALVDPTVRRMEAEAALELARAERIRQERLENARKDRAAMRRALARRPKVEPQKALPPPAPPTPPAPVTPPPTNDLDRRRRKKAQDVATEQIGMTYGPPLPTGPKATPVPTGRHPQAHQVTGHWVNQRWGPGRCYVKRIWIVGYPRGGKGGPPEPTAGSEAG